MKSYLNEFVEIMTNEGLEDLVIQSFSNSYYKILEGATGTLSETEIEPPTEENLVDYDKLESEFDKGKKLRNAWMEYKK